MLKIADIIKYEGDNSTFIWKHPCEDFNSTTQLIVHESQEAIFFMNGQILDSLVPADTHWKQKIFQLSEGYSTNRMVINHHFIVKFILSTKLNKWLLSGVLTQK